MRRALGMLPNPLLWSLAATTLCLLLVVSALAFVWLATDASSDDHPEIRPPASQPGPPVPR